MPDKKAESCVEVAAGPIAPEAPQTDSNSPQPKKEVTRMTASVGKVAPDFEANAYHDGGFKTVKLSDFRGKWIMLCFYPGDFTFV